MDESDDSSGVNLGLIVKIALVIIIGFFAIWLLWGKVGNALLPK